MIHHGKVCDFRGTITSGSARRLEILEFHGTRISYINWKPWKTPISCEVGNYVWQDIHFNKTVVLLCAFVF